MTGQPAGRSGSGEGRRRILVVDDAEGFRTYLASFLESQGVAVDTAADGESALSLLERGADPDLVLLDVLMPGCDGIETLRRIRELDAELPVVMLSVVGSAGTIVDAMRAGAHDFVNKPFEEGELVAVIERALESAPDRCGAVPADRPVLWQGEHLAHIESVLERISDTDVTVLIQGESGTGKEVVARAVHKSSIRSGKRFVKLNCAALPGELLESELFGYEKGAFTGATARKPGKFDMADGGTLFLDEIGEMSPAAQAKLLHVLQDGTFTRLGGNHEQQVDVRIVSATNRPLEEMVGRDRFREDLFFRLNVVNLKLPPLRERREEVPDLIEHFLARFSGRYGRPRPELSPALQSLLDRHTFPGNIRELENLIKRIVVLGSEERVTRELLDGGRHKPRGSRFQELLRDVEQRAGELSLREVGRMASLEAERETIDAVLQRTGWNRKQAAKVLGVSYKTLLLKIRACELVQPG